MKKVRITLEFEYDPTEYNDPAEWVWADLLDTPDDVTVIERVELNDNEPPLDYTERLFDQQVKAAIHANKNKPERQ